MEDHRKRIMRCEHPTPCESCLDDCKRAELTAKEDEIKKELLKACEVVRGILIGAKPEKCTACNDTGHIYSGRGDSIDCDECNAYALGRLEAAIAAATE